MLTKLAASMRWGNSLAEECPTLHSNISAAGIRDGVMLGNLRTAGIPFVPIIVGIALKVVLIDSVDRSKPWYFHFERLYLPGIWIELISLSFLATIAWAYTNREATNQKKLEAYVSLLIVPILLFILCAVLSVGLPKFGDVGEFVTLYLPFFVGIVSVAYSSITLTRL